MSGQLAEKKTQIVEQLALHGSPRFNSVRGRVLARMFGRTLKPSPPTDFSSSPTRTGVGALRSPRCGALTVVPRRSTHVRATGAAAGANHQDPQVRLRRQPAFPGKPACLDTSS